LDIEVVGDTGDGAQAIELARGLAPDVMLLDILMPGISGLEAARKILEQSPGIGIIILSMHVSREHVFHALQAGCKGYVWLRSRPAWR
jgi:DNA-binding NarL/FixJ family response regulator